LKGAPGAEPFGPTQGADISHLGLNRGPVFTLAGSAWAPALQYLSTAEGSIPANLAVHNLETLTQIKENPDCRQKMPACVDRAVCHGLTDRQA